MLNLKTFFWIADKGNNSNKFGNVKKNTKTQIYKKKKT